MLGRLAVADDQQLSSLLQALTALVGCSSTHARETVAALVRGTVGWRSEQVRHTRS